jgi:L-ectoine synthase
MKVIDMIDLANTDRDVRCPNGGFRSKRALIESDKMGFSLHQTIIPAGKPQHWHYKYHLEACYCISGYGLLTNCETMKQYEIKPDMVYVLDNHDDHFFQAIEDVVLISVFNPPVVGDEVHDVDGSYQTNKEVSNV